MATRLKRKTNSPGDFKKIEAIAGTQLRVPGVGTFNPNRGTRS
jgi:hypothetical protein